MCAASNDQVITAKALRVWAESELKRVSAEIAMHEHIVAASGQFAEMASILEQAADAETEAEVGA